MIGSKERNGAATRFLLSVFVVGALCLFAIHAPARADSSINQAESGRRIVFAGVLCGQNGLRQEKTTIQVIVLGYSGNMFCKLRLTEKLLRVSDFKAGYACSSARSAARVFFVKRDDSRVTRYPKYRAQLALAEEFARLNDLALQVIYIPTGEGSIHREPRCRKLLLQN